MESPDGSPAADQTRALRWLKEGQRFLLVGHERADGDVLGSQLALAELLLGQGKSVRIVNPDPPAAVLHLGPQAVTLEVDDGGPLPAHDVAVFLDFAEIGRTGAMAERLLAAPSAKVVIDHHLLHGPRFWDGAYRDPGAAATGQLVYRLARELGWGLSERAARAIFCALVTDTGWFRHPNTDAEVLRTAADLVERGASPAGLHEALFQRRDAGELAALSTQLGRLEWFADGAIALCDLPLDLGGGGPHGDGDGVLGLARSVGTVRLALYLREVSAGTWRLSARAKGEARVHGLAQGFGGGGHAMAAGATLVGDRETVRERVLSAARAELERVREAS